MTPRDHEPSEPSAGDHEMAMHAPGEAHKINGKGTAAKTSVTRRPPSSKMLDAALAYARMGWRVIPLHNPILGADGKTRCSCPKLDRCSAIGKHPRIADWTHAATSDADAIREWWKDWPSANIGIAMGAPVGWALDVDPRSGGDDTLAKLETTHGKLPATVEAITGSGGRHVIFVLPENVSIRNRVKVAPGLDVRSDGGLIVVAPSLHASGKRYAWEASSRPDEVPTAATPAWLLDLVTREPAPSPATTPTADGLEPLDRRVARARHYIARLPGAVAGEGGHTLTWKVALILARGFALPRASALELLAAEYNPRCSPPWDRRELEHKIDSAIEDGEADLGYLLKTPANLNRGEREEDHEHAEHAPVKLEPGTDEASELAAAEHLTGYHAAELRFARGLGWLAWDGKRWAQDEARAAELAKDTLRRMLLRVEEELADAQERIEQTGGKKDPKAAEAIALRDRILARKATCKRLEASRGIASMLTLAESDPKVRTAVDLLDADPYLLNAANGTIDLRTGKLRPHDAADLITRLSPVAYDPAAPIDDWIAFMRKATLNDESLIAYMQRCAGYSLTGETTQEKLFFISGPPGSGKGTFADAVRGVAGDYGTSSSFDTWAHRAMVSSQRPDLATLAGSRMVTCSEVDADKRLDEGVISNATGGDPIAACHKYKNPFTFKPRFKLWLLANKRPRVNDVVDETGIWRRLVCLPFEHVVPKEERNPDIKARFADPARGGPAVLRWCVEGARLYLSERRLVEPKRVDDATEAYRAENDPIRDFIDATCVIDKHAWVLNARLRELYEKWAQEEGKDRRFLLGGNAMGARLKASPYSCQKGQRSVAVGGKSARAWFGIRERTAEDDERDAARERIREAENEAATADPAEQAERAAIESEGQ